MNAREPQPVDRWAVKPVFVSDIEDDFADHRPLATAAEIDAGLWDGTTKLLRRQLGPCEMPVKLLAVLVAAIGEVQRIWREGQRLQAKRELRRQKVATD